MTHEKIDPNSEEGKEILKSWLEVTPYSFQDFSSQKIYVPPQKKTTVTMEANPDSVGLFVGKRF